MKDVRRMLAGRSSKDLLALIGELYRRDAGNRHFIHAQCAVGDAIGAYKQIIEEHLCPDPMSSQEFSLAAARKAISDYRRAQGDPASLLDLTIHYVECGTRCTLDYGDMWEAFYNSMESMFRKAVGMVEKSDPETQATFLPRLAELVRATQGVGWGYHDELADIFGAAFPDIDWESLA